MLLGSHADKRKSEQKSGKEIDRARNFVSWGEAEQLAKNLGRWSKRNVPYVECDAREKGGLQAVMEAVIDPRVAHIQAYPECTFADCFSRLLLQILKGPQSNRTGNLDKVAQFHDTSELQIVCSQQRCWSDTYTLIKMILHYQGLVGICGLTVVLRAIDTAFPHTESLCNLDLHYRRDSCMIKSHQE